MAKTKLNSKLKKELVSMLLIGDAPAKIIEYFIEQYNISLSHTIISHYKRSKSAQRIREEVGKSVYSIMPYEGLGNLITQLKEIKKSIVVIDNIIDRILSGKLLSQRTTRELKGYIAGSNFVAGKNEKAIQEIINENKLDLLIPLLETKRKYLSDAKNIVEPINTQLHINSNNNVGLSVDDLFKNLDKIDDKEFDNEI